MMNNYDIKLEVIDIEIYRQALTHKSYIKKDFYSKNYNELEKAKLELGDVLELRDDSNERLEFLGDTVIKSVIAEYLFERYPLQDEGFMTRLNKIMFGPIETDVAKEYNVKPIANDLLK